MQGGGAAIVPHAAGIDVEPADLIGTELTEKQMLSVRRENCAMHMRGLLAGQVGTADAGNQQGVQRGDDTILTQAVHAKRTTGIVGDSEEVTVCGDIAGILTVNEDRFLRFARNDTGRLCVQELEAVAAPTPGPDGGRRVRHLAYGVHLVTVDSEIGGVGHLSLRDRRLFRQFTRVLVEIVGVEAVRVSADKHRKDVGAGAGGKGEGHEEKQISPRAPFGRKDSSE